MCPEMIKTHGSHKCNQWWLVKTHQLGLSSAALAWVDRVAFITKLEIHFCRVTSVSWFSSFSWRQAVVCILETVHVTFFGFSSLLWALTPKTNFIEAVQTDRILI